MKHRIITTAFALAIAAPFSAAFAQDAATLVCADYAAMDNAGQMAMVANIESMNSEMAIEPERLVGRDPPEADGGMRSGSGCARCRRLEEDQRHVDCCGDRRLSGRSPPRAREMPLRSRACLLT